MRAQNAAWMDRVRPGWRDHPGLRITTESFLFRDPPGHTRLRRLVSGTFTQRKAEDLRDFMAGTIHHLLDLGAGARPGGGVGALHQILPATLPLPVGSQGVGAPPADHPLLPAPPPGLRLP